MTLDAIIRGALRHRGLVVIAAVAWLLWGVDVLRTLPVDVLPDLDRPTVAVLAEAGGRSPESVEAEVVRPIEVAMLGAPGVRRVRAQAAPGLGAVWVEFEPGVSTQVARQQVSERLTLAAARLPDDVTPTLGPVSSVMGEILLLALRSPGGSVDGPALRRIADRELVPRLSAVPGVSLVTAIGGGLETVDVTVRPEVLAARGISLGTLRDAVAATQATTSGGFVEDADERLLVQTTSRSLDPAAIGRGVLTERDGVAVHVSDVATVMSGVAPRVGAAGLDGTPAVILSVQKQPGVSTTTLTAAVLTALDGALVGVPDVEVRTVFRQADFLDAAVGNVEVALRDGAVLVVIVLVVFLRSWRTTLITLLAIPLSFVSAVLALRVVGLQVDTMTLGGLAIAVGELVDDAIVDVENVWRRLRDNAASASPRAPIRVVWEASREVRHAIVVSTVLVVLVFLPMFALEGLEGALFRPLAVAYVASILASMVVSLTVTPALASLLLPQVAAAGHASGDGWVVSTLRACDRALLTRVLDRPRLVVTASLLAVLVALASVPWLGTSFLPPFSEGTLVVGLVARPGIGLDASERLGRLAETLLLEHVPEVAHVGRRTGRAELDEHAEGVHASELDVELRPSDRPREQVVADVRTMLARLPGVSVSVGQPIGHRLDHLLSGVRAGIVVKLIGDDLPALRAAAVTVRDALADVPGVVDLQIEPVVLVPQLAVDVDRERAARFGMTAAQVAEDVALLTGGAVVASVPDGPRAVPLRVHADLSGPPDPERIAQVPLVAPDGHVVTVGQLAHVARTTTPNQILHEAGRRRLVVSANATREDPGGVATRVESVLASVPLPAGVSLVLDGQLAGQRAAARRLVWIAGVSLVGMIAVLHAHLRSLRLALQVLLNLPLAWIGGIAAVWLSGQPLSIASLVGFVTLGGIATRNTLLMITHWQHLRDVDGMPFGHDLVVRGALERLVPVLMTALCAGIALVPLALSAGAPGREILAPLAQVVLGGLVTSTLLDAVVTPTVFYALGGSALPAPPSTLDPLET